MVEHLPCMPKDSGSIPRINSHVPSATPQALPFESSDRHSSNDKELGWRIKWSSEKSQTISVKKLNIGSEWCRRAVRHLP